MQNRYMRMWELLGEVLVAALLGAGLTMLLAESAGQNVDAGRLYMWAGIAALALFGLSLSRASGWITLCMLVTAAFIGLLAGWKPLESLRAFFSAVRARADFSAYANSLALGAMLLLLVASYIIAHQPGGVYLMAFASVASLAIGWYYGEPSVSIHILPVLASLSAMFARAGGTCDGHMKPLLSLSLASAILACLLVPAQNVAYAPFQNAAQKALQWMIRAFNIENDDLEARRSFTIATDGWLASRDVFGGPAYPSQEPILRVESGQAVYLRGAIRYVYNNRAWVDEDNESKAGKIKRYMLGGIEGLIYQSEYDKAFDLNLARADAYFESAPVSVTLLEDNPYWSIYSPNRASELRLQADANAYFNNVGELFASRPLEKGDGYTLLYGALNLEGDDLAEAIAACAGGNNAAYAGALSLNRALPEGINERLYAAVYQIIEGAETPYEKACAIRDWLRANGRYTLTPGYVPNGQDMVSYFVLSSREGYCVYFASAMAVMARIAGLPARYVEGYLAEPDASGVCVVTGENAHAWAEVYFDGFGWLTFDATPGDGDADDARGDNGNHALPTPSPSPTPVPTPEPTPVPTEALPSVTPTPTPGAEAAPDEAQNLPTPTPTPAPATQSEPPEAPDAPSQTRGRARRIALALICAALALAAFLLFLRARLRATNPLWAAPRQAQSEDRLMCWYRAMLAALAARGARYENGDTPESFANRALAGGACTEDFVRFSREVARIRYAEREADNETYALAKRAYRGVAARMNPRQRCRWLARRVLAGIGPLHSVP